MIRALHFDLWPFFFTFEGELHFKPIYRKVHARFDDPATRKPGVGFDAGPFFLLALSIFIRRRRASARYVELHADCRANGEFGVRVAAGRIVHDGVHQSFNRHCCPKRVVAFSAAVTRLGTERYEVPRDGRLHDGRTVGSRDGDVEESSPISSEIRLTRFDPFILYQGTIRSWPTDQSDITFALGDGLKIALRGAASIRMARVVRFVGDSLTEGEHGAARFRRFTRKLGTLIQQFFAV